MYQQWIPWGLVADPLGATALPCFFKTHFTTDLPLKPRSPKSCAIPASFPTKPLYTVLILRHVPVLRDF